MEPLDGRSAADKAGSPTTPHNVVSAASRPTSIVRNPVVPAVQGDAPSSPTTTRKELGAWTIGCQRLSRIISAQEIGRWESAHHLGCIPEIVFPGNAVHLSFTNKATNTKTTLTVDAETYFVSASEFYKASREVTSPNYATIKSSPLPATDKSGDENGSPVTQPAEQLVLVGGSKGTPDETYLGMLEDQSYLKIPVADSWKDSKFGTFDPNIDWASRSNYICGVTVESLDGTAVAQGVPAPSFKRSPTEVINYELLKRRDLDILLYDAFDLFEDDLHDCGISKASVKLRVMPLCIFILVRHVVRIDAAAAMARDVRLFVELDPPGVSQPRAPRVVAEVTYRHTVFPSTPVGLAPGTSQQQTRQAESTDKAHLKMGIDALVESMTQVHPAKNYVLEL
eukprot:GILK01018937.1.p1 GENE.GILK01018937.1~~GILK01018937.1.p1  ORF type:complete len:396 (+),score=24.44 GILK01018937.1:2-1189(+)